MSEYVHRRALGKALRARGYSSAKSVEIKLSAKSATRRAANGSRRWIAPLSPPLPFLWSRVYGRPGREACGRRGASGAGEATVGFGAGGGD